MCYRIDFIDTAYKLTNLLTNFIRRTKLLSSFLREDLFLKQQKFLLRLIIFHGIDSFQVVSHLFCGYSPGIGQSKISNFQVLNT